MSFTHALMTIWFLGAIAAGFWLWRYRPFSWAPRHTLLFALGWVVVLTLPYWGAGPYSYADISEELPYGVGIHVIAALQEPGTIFAHSFALGHDIYGTSDSLGQLFSPERWLVTTFPTWLAYLIHKVSIAAVGFSGAYVLVRRMGCQWRFAGLAIGALTSVAHIYVTTSSWQQGMGYALAPWIVYLTVDIELRGRLAALGAIAVLFAFSSSLILSLVAVLPAAATAALAFGPRHLLRSLPGLLLFTVVVLLLGHETLTGLAQFAPYSTRALPNPHKNSLTAYGVALYHNTEGTTAVIAATAVVLMQNWRRRMWAAAAVVLFLAYPLFLPRLPWAMLGMGWMQGFGFNYMLYDISSLLAVLVGLACAGGVGTTVARSGRLLAALVLCLACGRLAGTTAYELAVWLSEGGQNTVNAAVDELRDAPWRPEKPQRVMVWNYRLPNNTAAMAGLDTVEGETPVRSIAQARFIRQVDFNFAQQRDPSFNAKCCRSYDATAITNLDLLRTANVGFILSRLPLEGGGLTQVAGPRDDRMPPRSDMPLAPRLSALLHEVREPSGVRVYAVPDPLPRVFTVRSVRRVATGLPDDQLFNEIAKVAPAGGVVLDIGQPPLEPTDSLDLTSFTLVTNGVEATVSAPNGGVVGINIPYTPFWHAYADGREVPILSANVIHMAVAIPPKTSRLELRYERVLLRDRINRALGIGQ